MMLLGVGSIKTLMMEAVSTSETFINFCETTRRNVTAILSMLTDMFQLCLATFRTIKCLHVFMGMSVGGGGLASCCFSSVYQHFEESYCLGRQGPVPVQTYQAEPYILTSGGDWTADSDTCRDNNVATFPAERVGNMSVRCVRTGNAHRAES
jgi:hypothetical protein